eukprot:2926284-Lingulodinium_polyedra.AAC.1
MIFRSLQDFHADMGTALSRKPTWTFGTMCSGTDVCSLACQAVFGELRQLCPQSAITHLFSCD